MSKNKVTVSLVIVSLLTLLLGGTVGFNKDGVSLGNIQTIIQKIEGILNGDKIWYSEFLDLEDETGKVKRYSEKVKILYDNENRYVGESKSDQDGVLKLWVYEGFQRGEMLVFSYQGKNENTWYSIGNITLKNAGKVFIGEWVGKTCNGANIIRCPYILSTNNEKDLFEYRDNLKEEKCMILVDGLAWEKYIKNKPIACKPAT